MSRRPNFGRRLLSRRLRLRSELHLVLEHVPARSAAQHERRGEVAVEVVAGGVVLVIVLVQIYLVWRWYSHLDIVEERLRSIDQSLEKLLKEGLSMHSTMKRIDVTTELSGDRLREIARVTTDAQ